MYQVSEFRMQFGSQMRIPADLSFRFSISGVPEEA